MGTEAWYPGAFMKELMGTGLEGVGWGGGLAVAWPLPCSFSSELDDEWECVGPLAAAGPGSPVAWDCATEANGADTALGRFSVASDIAENMPAVRSTLRVNRAVVNCAT